MNAPRILIAGIGNVFLGDDGFGVEVVQRLDGRSWPAGVRVADFGIRGFDLACALMDPHELVVLVDAVQRGGKPGTLYLLEAETMPDGAPSFEGHGMDPAQVLRNVRAMGGSPGRVLVVGCEPESFGEPETGRMGLSASVAAAVDGALGMIESEVQRILEEHAAHA
jgi:hydrogenase maturation protease